MDSKGHEILVVPSPSSPVEGTKGIFDRASAPLKLNVDVLRQNITNFLESVNLVLAGIPRVTEPYKLDEIELTVEVNAEGNIQLIGGIKAGATGGLTLRMKR